MHARIHAADAPEAIPLLAVDKDNLDAVCGLFEGRLVLCARVCGGAEARSHPRLRDADRHRACRARIRPAALFANRDDIAAARETQNPLWRLPLWRPYLALLEFYVADLANGARHATPVRSPRRCISNASWRRRRGVISMCMRGMPTRSRAATAAKRRNCVPILPLAELLSANR
jgi:hypothetical protein